MKPNPTSVLTLEYEADVTVLRVQVEGRHGDQEVRHIFRMLDRYDPQTGTLSMARTTGYTATAAVRMLSEDGRRLLVIEMGEGGINQEAAGSPLFFDLDTGTTTRLETHGTRPWYVALSRDGTVAVTQVRDGIMRVGPVTGEEPHLLMAGFDIGVATIDPLGRWIASSDGLVPMPDLSKPPLHTLPLEDLIAKLKTLTNLRVVRDEVSSVGWKVEIGPFPGWAEVPEW